MEILVYIAIGLSALLLALIALVVVRALLFRPRPEKSAEKDEISFDKDRAHGSLSELIKCRTVSNSDPSLEDDEEFGKLLALLPELYPEVFSVCEYRELSDRGLLFRWRGESPDNPTVLMAHYDVVPVNENMWEEAPFSGAIKDGFIHGRGALDTKATFSSILFAASKLIADGFTPKNDIYFAFSGGEEINGPGASNIVDYFEREGITPSLVLDEGGAVVENVFPGVKKPCALIGIAEKGMLELEFKVKSNGGHSSAPKPGTPIAILSRTCCKVESKPFKRHLTAPVAYMFDTLARHSTFLYRLIFSNLWAFGWLLDIICKKTGGDLNAMMRTTVAFTQMSGSSASNVLPPVATMVTNMRLNPCDTTESAHEYIRRVVNDDRVEVNLLRGMNPSRISRVDTEGFLRTERAILSTWDVNIVSPYLMVQCSDSKHWGRISDRVYRFSAMDLSNEERATIHGNNERIRLDCLDRCCEFYIRLMKNS